MECKKINFYGQLDMENKIADMQTIYRHVEIVTLTATYAIVMVLL